MIGARIKCDNCEFIGDMDFSAGCKTTVTAPSGWAVVYPCIRIKGERDMTQEQKAALKAKVREKTPAFHVCPRCIFGAYEVRIDRLLGVVKDAV